MCVCVCNQNLHMWYIELNYTVMSEIAKKIDVSFHVNNVHASQYLCEPSSDVGMFCESDVLGLQLR